jgi:hypothetical protein
MRVGDAGSLSGRGNTHARNLAAGDGGTTHASSCTISSPSPPPHPTPFQPTTPSAPTTAATTSLAPKTSPPPPARRATRSAPATSEFCGRGSGRGTEQPPALKLVRAGSGGMSLAGDGQGGGVASTRLPWQQCSQNHAQHLLAWLLPACLHAAWPQPSTPLPRSHPPTPPTHLPTHPHHTHSRTPSYTPPPPHLQCLLPGWGHLLPAFRQRLQADLPPGLR